jgi:hypothetical protein
VRPQGPQAPFPENSACPSGQWTLHPPTTDQVGWRAAMPKLQLLSDEWKHCHDPHAPSPSPSVLELREDAGPRCLRRRRHVHVLAYATPNGSVDRFEEVLATLARRRKIRTHDASSLERWLRTGPLKGRPAIRRLGAAPPASRGSPKLDMKETGRRFASASVANMRTVPLAAPSQARAAYRLSRSSRLRPSPVPTFQTP